MSNSLNAQETKIWGDYLSATLRLIEKLDHELQQRSHISLTDYEILSNLESASDKKVRMSDLANKVLVSRSRLTYRVDRLVEAGYIEREECSDDRRGLWAILTPKGAAALTQAEPGYVDDIKSWFFDQLHDKEVIVLGDIMSRIDEKLVPNR